MSNIAIVTTNKELSRFFELELKSWDHNVCVIAGGSAAADEYDFMIVDTDTVHNFKTKGDCPIVSVSATTEKNALQTQYSLPWPTSITAVNELCRKLTWGENFTRTLRDSDTVDSADKVYIVDRNSYTVAVSNRQVKLSANEFMILEELCASDGRTVKRDKIMQLLGAVSGNISDVYICRLRNKLEEPTGKRLIITERGVGYKTFLKLVE